MKIAYIASVLCALTLTVTAQSEAPKSEASATATAKPQDPAAQSQELVPAGAGTSFTAEQLEQIVAPVALHPDALLAQIMMASTYPLEIVGAHRWVEKNPSVTGKALEEALKKQSWDPSVKSLCGLPTVLEQMNDNLDWTQDLGDAFLGQKAELMQTVQKMRQKALEAGNLKTTEQQKVSEEGQIVIIESTKTEVVYVPVYSPTVVYGASWYYPTYYYPPMYYPPPAGSMAFAFAVGVAWGGCYGGCNWHGNDVTINVNNYNNFNNSTNINAKQTNITSANGNVSSFSHNPEHRKGANYKSPQTAQQYGGSGSSNRVTKDQARGYDQAGAKNTSAGGAQRSSAGKPPSSSTPKPSTGNANAAAGAASGSSAGAKSTPKASGGSGGALSGSRSPSTDRSASSRGASSSGGGGGRSGGGGGSGGGGPR